MSPELNLAACSLTAGVGVAAIVYALRCLIRDAAQRAEDLRAGRNPGDLP